jgi:eukaryotic-like serine/threonine-protein kinase
MADLMQPALALEFLAEIAVGPTCRVELCRSGGEGGDARLCAVKRLHPEIATRVEAEALLADVWQVAGLHHPNVVEVLGLGLDERGAWVAYELVEGISLARLMKTIGTTGESFHERMVVYLAWCVARGLVGANRLRGPDGGPLEVVHRDLIAESILVGFGGDVKISDLGWAGTRRRAAGGSRIAPLRRGSTLLAPEEVQGDEVAQRADVFALGALAFELIAGRPPWAAATRGDLLQRVTDEDAPPLERVRPGADPELCALVARCLARDPVERFQHASALLVQLEAWLAQKGYEEDNRGALARFVRRNAMKQMRWFERVLTGAPAPERVPPSAPPPPPEPSPRHREDIEAAVTTDERLPLRAATFAVDAPDAAAIAAAAGAMDEDEMESEVPTRLAIRSPVRGGEAVPASDDTVVDADHPLGSRPASSTVPPPSEAPSDPPTAHRVAPAGTPPLEAHFPEALSPPRVPSATSIDAPSAGRVGPPRTPSPGAGVAAPPPLSASARAPASAAPAAAQHARTPPPPASAPARPSAVPPPRSSAAPPRVARIDPGELDDARLAREADRLQRAAAVRAEQAQLAATEARAASDRAQVAAGKARRAHEAASLAREAARIAGKFGMAEAARKLERALDIEHAVETGEERGDEARAGGDSARRH